MIIYEGVIVEERGMEIADRKREESGRTSAVEWGFQVRNDHHLKDTMASLQSFMS